MAKRFGVGQFLNAGTPLKVIAKGGFILDMVGRRNEIFDLVAIQLQIDDHQFQPDVRVRPKIEAPQILPTRAVTAGFNLTSHLTDSQLIQHTLGGAIARSDDKFVSKPLIGKQDANQYGNGQSTGYGQYFEIPWPSFFVFRLAEALISQIGFIYHSLLLS